MESTTLGSRSTTSTLRTGDLQAKGAEFIGEPFEPAPGIRLAFLREPNGSVLELAQRDPKVFEDALAKGTVNW